MLRPNKSFHTYLLFSPKNLITCYSRINQNFSSSFGSWQAVCCYISMILATIRMKIFSEKRRMWLMTISLRKRWSN